MHKQLGFQTYWGRGLMAPPPHHSSLLPPQVEAYPSLCIPMCSPNLPWQQLTLNSVTCSWRCVWCGHCVCVEVELQCLPCPCAVLPSFRDPRLC